MSTTSSPNRNETATSEQVGHAEGGIDESEWLAVKSFNRQASSPQEIFNIVSISVDKEKIIIVSREHSRVATDDENTKQWFGVYTVPQLFQLHQQIAQIDPHLDELFPGKLRPIKGYLTTYFCNNLIDEAKKSPDKATTDDRLDYQDNELCNQFSEYLKCTFKSLGKSLYIDILFNDINCDQYFEIYSEFNLKRIKSEIESLMNELFPDLTKASAGAKTAQAQVRGSATPSQALKASSEVSPTTQLRQYQQQISKFMKEKLNASTVLSSFMSSSTEVTTISDRPLPNQQLADLKRLLDSYLKEDGLVEQMHKLHAEYYNNLAKPLVDSRELAKEKLKKYEVKLANQTKTLKYVNNQATQNELKQLNAHLSAANEEIADLTYQIDMISLDHKRSLIDLYDKILRKIKQDRTKFLNLLPISEAASATNATSIMSNMEASTLAQPSLRSMNMFDIMAKSRVAKYEEQHLDKKYQLHTLELKVNKRKQQEALTDESSRSKLSQELYELKLRELDISKLIYEDQESIVRSKLKKLEDEERKLTQEEMRFAKECLSLIEANEKTIKDYVMRADLYDYNFLNSDDENIDLDIDLADGLGGDIMVKSTTKFADETKEQDENEEEEEDEEAEFHDTYENPQQLFEEERRLDMLKKKEKADLKSKLSAIGAKKSELLLRRKKLDDKFKQELETEEAPKSEESPKKSQATKKLEDSIQSQKYLEERNKALKRIKEHKLKQNKMSTTPATADSSMTASTVSSVSLPEAKSNKSAKKPFVPNSKRTIRPPDNPQKYLTNVQSKLKQLKTTKAPVKVSQTENEMAETPIDLPAPPPPPPPLPVSFDAKPAPPPPPPPPADLFSSYAPPPPPPPPLPMFINEPSGPPPPLFPSPQAVKKPAAPAENSSPKPAALDMDQIKNFKFKSPRVHVPKESSKPKEESPRECLLNDIKKLGIEGHKKLRKVDKSERQTGAPAKSRNWTDDLNNKIKEMHKYMNDDEDEEEEDDESLLFENEFYNRS